MSFVLMLFTLIMIGLSSRWLRRWGGNA